MSLLSFAAGFVSGWLVRSTVDSSRDLAVKLASGYHTVAKRAESVLVAEREFLEDLWAEVAASTHDGDQVHRPSPSAPRRTPSHDGAVAS